MEHPNAARIRGLFDAFHRRDVTAIADAIAVDAVWHFPGRNGQLAGTHAGHEAIFGFLAKVARLTDETFSLDLEAVIADDELAVALFRGRGRRNGRALDNPTCLKIRLRGGQAVEIWEFVWDLFAVDEFWT